MQKEVGRSEQNVGPEKAVTRTFSRQAPTVDDAGVLLVALHVPTPYLIPARLHEKGK
jgi:hypothetical protein